MHASIRAIEYYLPEGVLTNDILAETFSGWTAAKVADKIGIVQRHIAAPQEYASDLAVAAAQKLFASGVCGPEDVEFLLLCTQSPDYFLPTTACILQDRLGLPRSVGALDFNLGCSGFIYGLSLAKGLIETGQVGNVLLLTADTYSKFLHPNDKSVRAIFGDAAAATLVQRREDSPPSDLPWIGPFVFGTDGKGMENLIVRAGGIRKSVSSQTLPEQGVLAPPFPNHLYMNGPEIFSFALQVVPEAIKTLLARAEKTIDDIDLFVFHQANRFILEHLRDKLKIPAEKFVFAMSHVGNTVSSSIPIALEELLDHERLPSGKLILLMGFGVGYSWGATLIRSSL